MKHTLIFLLCLASLHAEVPTQPLANKGALLFSDTFSAPEVGKA